MSLQRSTISRQLWVVLVCLLVFTSQMVEAQDELPPIVVYAIETQDDNLYGYTYDLYAVNTDTHEILFEATTSDDECFRAISPNRQWLLYSIYSPGSSSASQSYAVDLYTGETIEIGQFNSAQWSPDSQQFVYAQDTDSGQNVYVFNTQSHEIEYSEFLMTYSPLDFAWSGSEWVYAQKIGDDVIDVGGGRQIYQRLDSPIADFTLSPDAEWIALVLGERANRYLFVMNTDTGEKQQLVDTAIGGAVPVWSSDGRGLAYSAATGLYVWDAEQQTSQQLVRVSEGAEISLSSFIWSPDNRYLAYREYVPGGTQNTQYVIQILEVETGDIQFVRQHIDTFAGELSWVNDTQLAYTYADSETAPDERIHDVYLYDVTTGESVNLTNSPETERFICQAG